MPTVYHDNCAKPGPTSNDYLPPPDARLFKSRSAPNSPMLARQTLLPPRLPRPRSPTSPRVTRSATLLVEKRKIEKTEKLEIKSKASKGEQKWKIGRSRSFTNKAEQKKSLGKVWHPGCLRCEECGKRLNPGQHSEHQGIPYCNIPCYSMLFGPGGYGHGGTESHSNYGQKTSSEEREALRNELIPKLKAYNTYFEDQKACQLSSKEVNGRIILEGVLRVYWGLRNPVTLGNHRLGDWRRQSNRGSKSHMMENNTNAPTVLNRANTGKENISQSQAAQRPRSTSIEKILARRRSIERQQSRNNPGVNDKKEQTIMLFTGRRLRRQTSFIPPYGTSTNLRLTSRIPTKEVVKMLLAKFQITDNPKKFNIYARYDNGAIRQLNDNEYPLLCRLLLGANEELVKLYIMGSDEANDISAEVAQYIHFSIPVLEAFLKKFKEEEEREVERIKERYAQYRALLQQRLAEISTCV